MTLEEKRNYVKTHQWYQTIDFGDGVVTKGCAWCGEPAWSNIRKFLPESLEGKRVLDLGCNAGLFCVRCALLGAKEVVGIDWPGWRPEYDFQEQQQVVKSYFEELHNKQLPITYLSGKMEDILQQQDLGQFDYVLAIASIYYTGAPAETVERISQIGQNFILRLRDANRISLFTSLCTGYGYKSVDVIQEKWWEKLDIPTDDFYLYHYRK